MKEQLAALYALQQQDSLLSALKRQYSLLDAGKAEKAEYDAADAANKEALEALHTVSADLKDAELEQQQVETKRQEYEVKLYSGKVTNHKELQAMQEEVEMLGRQRTKLDDKIITLLDLLETRKTEQAATSKRSKTAKAALKAKLEIHKEAAEVIRREAQQIVDQRISYLAPVPDALIKRYEALRLSKAGVAIVALQDGNACGGCKMALPSSLVTKVHEGSGMETCQNCGRLLCEGEVRVRTPAGVK
jgi:predicted  nucleic acid-binding Zn-ribbon protein